MKIVVPFTLALLMTGGQALATRYDEERPLRIEWKTSLELETTSMEVTRDGEPVEAGSGAGPSLRTTHHAVVVDRVLETREGRPARVRRAFETLEGKGEFTFGEETRDSESEVPLEGVTLELVEDEEGEVQVEVVEGEAPSDDSALEGHVLALALDALLPEGEVEVGAEWELESAAILRALALDVDGALFPPPEAEEPAGGGGERGGQRSGRGRMRGLSELFGALEWEGTAKLEALDEEHEGTSCAAIAIELEGRGELEEPEPPGGGGRERLPGILGPGPGSSARAAGAAGTSAEVALTGKLLFALEEGRPLLFEVEGHVTIERDSERSRGGSSMRVRSTQVGQFTQRAELTQAE